VPAPVVAVAPPAGKALRLGWLQRWATDPSYAFRSVLAGGALAVTLVGSAPAALAAANPNANPLLTQAINGPNDPVDFPAPAVSLVDQYGSPVSLAGLRGKAVVVTFLDPVCTSDCPVIAQELKQTDALLGPRAKHVELVAVNANPRYTSREFLAAFDAQEGMDRVPNWLFLTGSLPQLEHAWRVLGATVSYLPGGAMINHSEYAYVIGPAGHVRYEVGTDPGQATAATKSSFASNLADLLVQLLK
jgi:cytochrome oxidase Cu insertion factor (SCO1/SenC/PrrC family)